MKPIYMILLSSVLYHNSKAQALRNITDIYNKTTSIDSLKGTKLLIVVLPAQTDTALNNQLLRFQKTFLQKVKVIALVTTQPGAPSREFYKTTYATTSRAGVIVSEGVAGTEKPDNERAAIIQWMTSKSNNRQQDRYATGSKFFLSEDGRLYAQLDNRTSLDDPLVKCILNTKVPTAKVNKSPIKSQQP